MFREGIPVHWLGLLQSVICAAQSKEGSAQYFVAVSCSSAVLGPVPCAEQALCAELPANLAVLEARQTHLLQVTEREVFAFSLQGYNRAKCLNPCASLICL